VAADAALEERRLVSLGRYSTTTILFVSILSISSELILRNQLAFQQIYSLKMQTVYGAAGKRSLLKQNVLPEDIAEAIYFFASDASSKCTGNIINVDAGNAQAFTR